MKAKKEQVKPITSWLIAISQTTFLKLWPSFPQQFSNGNTVFISGLLKGLLGDHHQLPKQENEQHVSCHVCGKVFRGSSRAQNLKRHFNNVHLKLKPFRCIVCGMMFGLKYNLKSHMSRAHNIPPVILSNGAMMPGLNNGSHNKGSLFTGRSNGSPGTGRMYPGDFMSQSSSNGNGIGDHWATNWWDDKVRLDNLGGWYQRVTMVTICCVTMVTICCESRTVLIASYGNSDNHVRTILKRVLVSNRILLCVVCFFNKMSHNRSTLLCD